MISALMRAMGQRPVAYYPVLAKIMGSASGGLILSQLLYWALNESAKQGDRPKFWKTDKELRDETLTSEWEFRKAKERLASLPFIQISVEGLPARTFYTIDLEQFARAIVAAIDDEMPSSENSELSCFEDSSATVERHSLNCARDPLKTSENTTEITTENNNKLCSLEHNLNLQKDFPSTKNEQKRKPANLRLSLYAPKDEGKSKKQRLNYFQEIAFVARQLGEALDPGDIQALLRVWKILRAGDAQAGVSGLSMDEILDVCQRAKAHAQDGKECKLAYLIRNWTTAKWLADGAPKKAEKKESEEMIRQRKYQEALWDHIRRISAMQGR